MISCKWLVWLVGAGAVVGLALAWPAGCGGAMPPNPRSAQAEPPSIQLLIVSSLAGALEPCGCVKDMLGGVDHAAAFVAKAPADRTLLVAAGATFFKDPKLEQASRIQDRWKAEAIAEALSDMNLVAWAPGANDWAGGGELLAELAKRTGATPLAATLPGFEGTRVEEVGGYRVGLAGVSVPEHHGELPDAIRPEAPEAALKRAHAALRKQDAQVFVALLAVPRGAALRLAESVAGFDVMVVGKPYDEGDENDAVIPPVLVGKTLVVQAPNHLQGIAVVDLHVRDGSFDFQDGSGVNQAEQRASIERRIEVLEKRITAWKKRSDVAAKDIEAREADLAALRRELSSLKAVEPPEAGSFFRYDLRLVREKLGTDPRVKKRMDHYYRRVNEHNRVAFADRKPPEVSEGQSSYIGVTECAACHAEALKFYVQTGHATAYATLEKQHKQFNLDCVGCHVTGYEEPGGSTVTHVSGLKSVQCETCHGPGSRHAVEPENPEFIIASPAKTLCAPKCHHPPHVLPSWNVEEAWKHIIGPGHGK